MAAFDWLENIFNKKKESYFSFPDRMRLKELIDTLSQGSFKFSEEMEEKLKHYSSLQKEDFKIEFEHVQDLVRIDYGLLSILSQLENKYQLEKQQKKFRHELKEARSIFKRLRKCLKKEKNLIKKIMDQGDSKQMRYGHDLDDSLLHDLVKFEQKLRITAVILSRFSSNEINESKPNIEAYDDTLYVEINLNSKESAHGSINSDIHIYDKQILVAIGCTYLKKDQILHSYGLNTLVPYAGYLRKAILLLLRQRKIIEWISSRSRTTLGDKLFESIAKEKDINAFIGEDKLWHVRLK